MKGLETGKETVKRICEALKKETLEPAKKEAEETVAYARKEAETIVDHAKQEAKKILEEAKLEVEKQKAVFSASLSQACRQSVDKLKEEIEKHLFSPQLGKLVGEPLRDPKILVKALEAIVEAIQKDGINTDLIAYISSAVAPREVNELLSSHVITSLRDKGVLMSHIGGGVTVKIVKDHVTLELSDTTVKELLGEYIRKDFREFVFGS